MKKSWILCLSFMLGLLAWQCSPPHGKLTPIKNGVQYQTAEMNIKVQFYADNSVRVVKLKPESALDTASLVVIQKTLPNLKIEVKEDESLITLTSATLNVIITKRDGHVEYLSKENKPILSEMGKADFTPFVTKNENAFSVKQRFQLTEDEGIYGLGQHQDGLMNYRKQLVTLVQANTAAVTPFLVSTKNYGILWDNYSRTYFDDKESRTTLSSDVAKGIDYYFIAGANMDSVILGYRKLTGDAPMYGKWAYGYWQSKEHYEDRTELLKVAKEYRDRKIPIDGIIQDWDYWDGNANWGQLFFDEKKYPNPKEMLDILHQQNFHAMISIWCAFGPKTPVYKEMDKKGLLYPTVGWADFKYYDAYNPAACDLYWKYANEGLFSKGIDGWWMDSTEPDIVNANTKDATNYEMTRMANNHLGSFAKYLNPYSLMATEAVYKNQRKVTDQKRVYILTRSTFAGQQRAAATTWSGDIGASWKIYRNQISAGLNHSLSGIPYWTFDIGAFVLGSYNGVFCNGGKDPSYQELYTRMFQFGSFCPIFRSHGSETPREIWEFGNFTNTLIKFDNLRYRLLPYTYSLASQVTNNGYTIMRALPMDFTADKKTYGIDDQFMYGSNIMVCPVTEYMLHRPPSSSVLVPASAFKTDRGEAGVEVKFFKDTHYKKPSLSRIDPDINIDWYGGRPDYVTDSSLAIKWKGKITPSETGKHQFHIKCYGPKHISINGKPLKFTYQSVEVYTEAIDLVAGQSYDLAIETENPTAGAFHFKLYWKTPSIFAEEKTKEVRKQTRNVYLPAGTQWYDFWTGNTYAGGKSIEADAPIEKIPVLVKAGSIIPMGQFVQYATEKNTDKLEIRIYPGANGLFVLYEDENDNYNYEKGAFANISLKWNDAKRQLTIGQRKGSFPGMLDKRTFNVIIVSKTKGTGIETTASPDKVLSYDGKEQTVQF